MLVIDHRLEAHVGGFGHQQVNFLADLIRGRGFIQVAIQACSGRDTTGVLVEIDVHHHVFARRHLAFFFGIRQQQIFGQPPIEEYTDAINFNHFQTGELTHLHFWFFSGSN